MPAPALRWPHTLDPDAPPALGEFLERTSVTWLPVAAGRREMGLPTVVAVVSLGASGRAIPCSPAEAAQLVPGVDLEEPPPDGAVWCCALLPGASGRWALRHALRPQRRARLEAVRGTGDDGDDASSATTTRG